MSRDAIGLDVGGANLKAATASGDAVSMPFELWRRPERLQTELARFGERWAGIPVVGVTMTGELCDCFETKRDGVRHILAAVEQAFPKRIIWVWSTAGQFVTIENANGSPLAVAAANWHALATLVGRHLPRGPALLIDTGSTTTDIIPIRDHVPVPRGLTDPDRLRSGELVYTGVRRTPVCAVLGSKVTAEWFATALDAYARLRLLPPDANDCSTADGRPLTDANAHARLARMLGGDPEVTPSADTLDLARRVFAAQRRSIAAGVRQVIEHMGEQPAVVCVCGSGEFLARAAWEDACPTSGARVMSLADQWGAPRAAAACAWAVAVLASEGGA
jgi:(4-(4-[2-(gamma-L-glutamylamino)ethyl]phenoxymethyl)furan-2-yl)methanamine synthase